MTRPLLRSLSLRHLVLVSTLGRELSFSRTAELLHTSQSALSRSLAQLEDQLDTRLFNRTTKRMSLTPAGISLMQHANRVLAEIESAQEELADIKQGAGGGEVRIGALAAFSTELLGAAMAQARRILPKVQFSVEVERARPLYEKLLGGSIDVMLTHVELKIDVNIVDVQELYVEDALLLVSRDHPLARRRSVTKQDLAAHALVLPSIDTAVRTKLNRLLSVHRSGSPLGGRDVETDSNTVALSLVRHAGLAWPVARRHALWFGQHEDVRMLEMKPQLLRGPICALTLRGELPNRPTRVLIDCLDDLAKSG